MKAIKNAVFITSDGVIDDKILLFDTHIVGFVDSLNKQDIEVIDAGGMYVSAGFIDIHIHGSGGADTMDATFESIDTISKSIVANGTTSFLPTTMTMSIDSIKKALFNISKYKNSVLGANILGVHMEGPFISPLKAGAQNASYIIPACMDLIDSYHDIIKMITIAPEEGNNLQIIHQIHKKYPHIILSIGHSKASYAQCKESFLHGISHVTHIFNAMDGYHHRDVGIIGAVFEDEHISCDIIADTIHTHTSTLELTHKLKPNNLILITDAMRAGCMIDGTYDLGGQKVIVQDSKAILEDGTLAGSLLTQNKAVYNMLRYTSMSLVEAIGAVTFLPAQKLGVSKGDLVKGFDADIVIFDKDINIYKTFINGIVKYTNNLI